MDENDKIDVYTRIDCLAKAITILASRSDGANFGVNAVVTDARILEKYLKEG